MSKDLFALVEQAVSDHPQRTALVTSDGQLVSYEKLAGTVEAFARNAAKAGISQGDQVAIEIGNHAIELCLIMALSRLGAVILMGARVRDFLAAGIRVDSVISIEIRLSPRPRNVLLNQTWFAGDGAPGEAGRWPGYETDDDIAIIATSSGTTGKPKFLPFTVDKIAAKYSRFDPLLGGDHINRLIVMDVQTMVGFASTMRTLSVGGLVVRPADSARKTLELCRKHKISEIFSIPNITIDLVKSQRSNSLSLPDLKQVVVAGSSISPQVARDVQKTLCPRVLISYGATEIGPITGTSIEALGDIPGAVGFVGSWVEANTVDDDGAPLCDGAPGRLRFRVEPRFRIDNYVMTDASDAAVFIDDWFYPGDLGFVTKDRLLVVTGRITDLINIGGDKISPEKIERMAASQDGVLLAGVVGVANASGFDDVCIAVVGEQTLDVEQLHDRLVADLGANTPLRVKLVDQLPLNQGGKIDRARLRVVFQT